MALIDIQILSESLTAEQKRKLISKVTDAVVAMGDEGRREAIRVKIDEVERGAWDIGGKF